MSKSCKVISIVTVLYLVSGLVNMILHPGVLAVAQLVYVGCFLVGALAALAAFTGPVKRYRALALWSVAPLIPVCGTGEWRIAFSGVPTFHHTVYLAWSSGRRVFLGVDLVPVLLLVLILVFSAKLIKEQQAPAPPS